MARIPLVRPPMFSQGGGQQPMGGSGQPGMPRPGTQRAFDLAQQYADDERGRFTERVFEFPPFPPAVAGVPSNINVLPVVSNRTSFVRLVAMRGGIKNSSTGTLGAFDLANLVLRLQINGEEDLTTSGNAQFPAEFDGLFTPVAPWFWFAAPPRLRVGDQLQATVDNSFTPGEGVPDLTPYLMLRIVDDVWWRELYGT